MLGRGRRVVGVGKIDHRAGSLRIAGPGSAIRSRRSGQPPRRTEVVVSSRRSRIQIGGHLTDEVLRGQVFRRSTLGCGGERAHLWLG